VAIYDSSVSATFLQQLFAERTKNYTHVISMYDPKKEYFPADYDSSHLPCYIPAGKQSLNAEGLPSGNRQTILPHVILHQPVSSAISDELIERTVSKLSDDYRAWFVTLFTTDTTGKRTAKNTIDPLAIVADYDRGIEPPTDERLIELGLPLPTVRVQSGGGDHLWWFLTEDSCTKEQRLAIMLTIIEKTGADPAMKDEARVLRLPGSIHLKNPADPKVVTIIEANYDRRFTHADFEHFIIANLPAPIPTPIPTIPKVSQPSVSQLNNTSYIPPIPLERCLSKEHREALAIGASDHRDNMGCSLARDLIGVANHVPLIQFDYKSTQYRLEVDGNPEQLLWDYCRRCSPPLEQSDYDRIYKSAQEYDPSPSIRDEEMLKNCLRSWVKENKKQNQTIKKNSSNDRTSSSDAYFEQSQFPYFTTTIDDGLVKHIPEIDLGTGEIKWTKEHIGNHLEAITYVNNPEQNGASIYVEFKNQKNHLQRWTMPRGAVLFEVPQMLAEFNNRGYYFNINKKKQLLEYLNQLGKNLEKNCTITDSTGWINGSYVSQNKTYSFDNQSDLKFRDIEPITDSISEIKGLLSQWQKYVGEKCAGNSRLIFAIGVSLAAPLQPLLNIESGGFHLVGTTSVGKTTILKIASSVVGIKDLPQWRTTTNGLESIACAHNHMLLPLDEIAQADSKEVGAIAYMLANGQGKTRMTKNLTNRKAKTWQLIFLSSGEVGLGQYMAQAGMSQKGGQEVRLPDIPAACNGSLYGAFETIHDCESSKEFAENLDAAAHLYHGTLLDAFLERLVVDVADDLFLPKLKRRLRDIAVKLATGTTDNAVSRVSTRFALLQVALELAHSYGLLPFPLEQIEWAIQKMFVDWLNSRGGDGSVEMRSAINRIQHLLVTNEFSDRVYTLPDNNERIVRNLLGYRKADIEGSTEEFWIPPSVFDKEICENMNKLELIKELQRVGLILPPRSDGSPKYQRKIKSKASYYYIFKGDFFSEKTAFQAEAAEAAKADSQNPIGVYNSPASDRFSLRFKSVEAAEAGAALQSLQKSEAAPEAGKESSNPVVEGEREIASTASAASDTFTLEKKSEENVFPDLEIVVDTHIARAGVNDIEAADALIDIHQTCNPLDVSQAFEKVERLNPKAFERLTRLNQNGQAPTINRLECGDRVRCVKTGVEGQLNIWYVNRAKAIIQFDDGEISDWILQSDLILINKVS
jgi:uncharacterized protein (DUF927 family)